MPRLLLLLLTLVVLAQAQPANVFLVLSDLHYNPFQQQGIPPRGQETTGELLRSTLDEARRICPSPRFILVTGDLLAHRWEELYARHRPRQSFREFTTETVREVASELHRRWPDTPILAVPGNEDSFEGNYQVRPDGPFLQQYSEVFAPLARYDVARTLREGGYWSVPTAERQLIGLNTVFFSANRVGFDDGSRELEWLDEELSRLERIGKKAWLVMHIPPGLDNYHTARAFEAGRPDPVELWRPEYLDAFEAVLQAHPGTVEAAIAGHTHRDDFRLIGPGVPCKIVPAVSPVYGNNPGFMVAAGDLSDYQMFYLDLEDPTWKLEYAFSQAYGLKGLDLPRLEAMLQPGTPPASLFQRYYSVSGPQEVTDQNLEVYRNSILHLRAKTGSTL